MLRRKMKKFKLRKYIVKKDTERNTALEYLDPVEGEAVIWPAGGKVQAELYGLRLAYMLNMNYYGDLNISENDAICIILMSRNIRWFQLRAIPNLNSLSWKN